MKIVVAICTRRRPGQLRSALQALAAVRCPAGCDLAALVVENDDQPTMRAFVEGQAAPFPFRYVHEPRAGLVPARNRALEEALTLGADWIVTTDDDGEMQPQCLEEYVAASLRFPENHLFMGRTRYIYPPGMPAWHPRPDETPIKTGQRAQVYSTSNAFISRAVVSPEGLNLRFNPAFSLSGAEDSEFFHRASKLAGSVIWVEEALVIETVVPERTSLKWRFARIRRNSLNAARVVRLHNSRPKAVLLLAHRIYKNLIYGLVHSLTGALRSLFSRDAGLKQMFYGFQLLTQAFAMLQSPFVEPMDWYKTTDGY